VSAVETGISRESRRSSVSIRLGIVEMANVEERVVIEDRHSEILNPSGSAQHVAPNFDSWKVDGRVELPFEAGHGQLVSIDIEGAVRRRDNRTLSTFHGDSQLFRILSLKNAEGRSGVQVGQ